MYMYQVTTAKECSWYDDLLSLIFGRLTEVFAFFHMTGEMNISFLLMIW